MVMDISAVIFTIKCWRIKTTYRKWMARNILHYLKMKKQLMLYYIFPVCVVFVGFSGWFVYVFEYCIYCFFVVLLVVVLAAGVAALVCWAGAIGGMLTSQWFRGPQHLLAGVLSGMAFRMALPLAVCMVAFVRGGTLVESGFVFYVLAFYLMTLAVDTWMATGRTVDAGPTSKDS